MEILSSETKGSALEHTKYAITEQILSEAATCFERGINSPQARAVIEAALVILVMDPIIPYLYQRAVMRVLEANTIRGLFWHDEGREVIIPQSVLISGAGIIYPEVWTAMQCLYHRETILEQVVKQMQMIIRMGLPKYYELANMLVLSQPNSTGSIALKGVQRVVTPNRLHISDPLWADNPGVEVIGRTSFLFPAEIKDSLRLETSQQLREANIPDPLSPGVYITGDTHQSLAETYSAQTFEELNIFRLDPETFYLSEGASLETQTQLALQSFIALCSIVRDQGRVLVTIGSGNNKSERLRRYAFMSTLHSLLKQCQSRVVRKVSPYPGKSHYMSALRARKPVRRPSWAIIPPRD